MCAPQPNGLAWLAHTKQAAKQTRKGTTDQRHKPQTARNGPIGRSCGNAELGRIVCWFPSPPRSRRASVLLTQRGRHWPARSLGLLPMVGVLVCLQSGALVLFQRTTGWDQAGRCCNAAPTLQLIQCVWLARAHRRCA
jgi:hypothetical protein